MDHCLLERKAIVLTRTAFCNYFVRRYYSCSTVILNMQLIQKAMKAMLKAKIVPLCINYSVVLSCYRGLRELVFYSDLSVINEKNMLESNFPQNLF